MRRLRGSRVALLGGLLLLAHVAPAGAFGGAPAFTMAPTEGGPYTVVSVSGTGCAEGPAPAGTGNMFREDTGVIVAFVASAGANGDWATTFRVPPSYPTGVYEVRASCVSDPNQIDATVFDYAPQNFTVLAGEVPVATASPLEGVAGQETVITVSGNLCLGSSVQVSVFRLPFELHDAVDQELPTPDGQGNWSTQLTVPAAQPAGSFGLTAQCHLSLSSFLYDLPDFVLREPGSPPATPVTRQPNFTG